MIYSLNDSSLTKHITQLRKIKSLLGEYIKWNYNVAYLNKLMCFPFIYAE